MNKNYLIYGFLLIAFSLIHVTEVQGQGFLNQFWKKYKKNIVFAEEYDDNTNLKLGIFVGAAMPNYIFTKEIHWYSEGIPINPAPNKTNLPDIGTFTSIHANRNIRNSGFQVGIPMDYKINDNLNFSFSPSIILWANHSLIYNGNGNEKNTKRFNKSTKNASNFNVLELPLALKLRSEKKYIGEVPNPYRMYLLGGFKYNKNLGAKSYYDGKGDNPFDHETTDLPLILKNNYFSFEAGLGIDIYFTYFKMSPEISFSQSMGNLLDKNHVYANDPDFPNPFMNAIENLGIRNIHFKVILQ